MSHASAESYRILHLSDIHFGASFDESLWDYIRALVRREHPRLIVCTGDLVDHGGLFMLALARRQLEQLQSETAEPAVLRSVPGNHDCGPFGNVRMRPFSTNFRALFGPLPIDLPASTPSYLEYIARPWLVRCFLRLVLTWSLYAAKWSAAVRAVFGQGPSISQFPVTRDDDPAQVALVYLDSNHAMRLASGNVDVRELTRLKAKVLNMRDDEDRSFVPRIALVHHHPLPIPDSKITEGLTSFEPFLVLRNAGIVLKELNGCDVDLILHGHKHYSTFSRLGYSIDHSVEGEIAVLGAGSAGVTHSEAGRNSVNFVDLYPNGRMSYTAIYFGGGAGAPVTELFRNKRYVHDMDMHKRRIFRRGIERHGQWAMQISHEVAIDPRGVAVVQQEVEGLRFERDQPATVVPIYISVSMGRIPPATLRLSEKSLRLGHQWVGPPTTPKSTIECSIDLGLPLTAASPAVTFGYEYLSFNTYAITEWETVEASQRSSHPDVSSGRTPGLEFTGLVVRIPVRQLILRLKLPRYAQLPEPRVRVMRWSTYPNLPPDKDSRQFRESLDGHWLQDTDMTEHESGRVFRLGDDTWELRVDFPLVGHRYDLTWRVRDPAEDKSRQHQETLRRGVTQAFRALLLKLDAKPEHAQAARNWIAFTHHILSEEFRSESGSDAGLSLALFVYDEASKNLRLVLEHPPHSGRRKGFEIPLGEGVVGAAMKRRAVVSYIDPGLSGNLDDAAYLYDPDDGAETPPRWKYLVAFPVFGLPGSAAEFADEASLDSGWSPSATVGILTLASMAPDSGLVRLTAPEAAEPVPPKTEPSDEKTPEVLTYKTVWVMAQLIVFALKSVSDSAP